MIPLSKSKMTIISVSVLVIYWGFLAVMTSLPASNLPSVELSDKLIHTGAFFVLGFLMVFTFSIQTRYRLLNERAGFFMLAAGLLYAAMDELHQMYIPGRSADILDFVADGIGLLLGLALFILFKVVLARKNIPLL